MIEKTDGMVIKDLHHVLSQLGDEPLLEELEQDVIGQLLSGLPGVDGPTQPHERNSSYNRIPSDNRGSCHSVLVAYCLKPDNFDKRLEEIIKHIEKCPTTERIYFITTKWRPDVWDKHEHSFRVMPAKLSVIMFALGRFVLLSSA